MKITIRQPLGFSEIGRKDNQEDCVYPAFKNVSAKNHFFVLCDGMGGHENGEVASATVCEAFGKYFETNQPEDGVMTPDLFKQALDYTYNELDMQDSGGLKKMGTTMTCLYLHKNGYLVAHIGDSRIYHVRPNTGIVYQSSDHSLVNDLLRAGELTEEEAVNFPQKNVITRAMQPNLERRHKADIYSFSDIQKGDYFFLCSDGVLEQLTNDKLCAILSDKNLSDNQKLDSIKQVCDGKTKDNYTCYLIPIDDVVVEKDDVKDVNEDMIVGIELDMKEEPVMRKNKMGGFKGFFSKLWNLKIILFSYIVLIAITFNSCTNAQKRNSGKNLSREFFKKELVNEFDELPVLVNGLLLTEIKAEDDYIVYVCDLTREEWADRFLPYEATNSDRNIARIISGISAEILQKHIDNEVGVKYVYRDTDSKGIFTEIEVSHERMKEIKEKLTNGDIRPYTIMELLNIEMSKYEYPAQIDENIWLTNAYIDGKNVFYEATIDGDLSDWILTDEEVEEVRQDVLESLLGSGMKLYKYELEREGVTFTYSYKDSSGKEFMRLVFTSDDYFQ